MDAKHTRKTFKKLMERRRAKPVPWIEEDCDQGCVKIEKKEVSTPSIPTESAIREMAEEDRKKKRDEMLKEIYNQPRKFVVDDDEPETAMHPPKRRTFNKFFERLLDVDQRCVRTKSTPSLQTEAEIKETYEKDTGERFYRWLEQRGCKTAVQWMKDRDRDQNCVKTEKEELPPLH